MKKSEYYYRLILIPNLSGDFGRVIEQGEDAHDADSKIRFKGDNLPEGMCLGQTLYGPFQELDEAKNDRKESALAG